MKSVFISHSNAEPDRMITLQLYNYLAEQKIDCWVDAILKAGTWKGQIGMVMHDCDVAVFVASRNSMRSDEVMGEIGYFLKEKKTVIPFVLDREYYLHPDKEAAQAIYLLGANSLEAVFVDDTDINAAFARLVWLLPAGISKLENNPADFVYRDGKNVLIGYNGTDSRVSIPPSVIEIDRGAFQNNDKLKKVVIPPSVKKIGIRAFFGCVNLMCIEGMDGLQEVEASALDCSGIAPSMDNDYTYSGIVFGCGDETKSLVIADGVKIIANEAFRYCGAKSVTLPQGLKTIGELAFADAVFLEEITVPETVTYIGKNAFRGCGRLKKAVFKGQIPANIESAFDNFSSIIKEN